MKLLVGIGEGIGNIIMSTPLIEALGRLSHVVDVFCTPNYPDSIGILDGWPRISKLSANSGDFNFDDYDKILLTPWFQMGSLMVGRNNILAVGSNMLEDDSEVEVNMRLARNLGYEGETPPYHIEYSTHRDFRMYEGVVGIHNGANPQWPFKKWPYFPELAKQLGRVVLVGTLLDKQDGFPPNVLDFQGYLSLRDTAALIKVCKYFITNDSGLMHIASALGVKTYAIFGPTSQLKNKPPDVVAISRGLECQPCQHTPLWGECRRNVECMTGLSAEDVYTKTEESKNG